MRLRSPSALVITTAFLTLGQAAQAETLFVSEIPYAGDFSTLQDAVDAAAPGDTIQIAAGDYAGALVNKTLQIKGSGHKTRITAPGPYTSFSTAIEIFGGDGTQIKDLTITDVPFGVYVGGADDVHLHNLHINIVSDDGFGWGVALDGPQWGGSKGARVTESLFSTTVSGFTRGVMSFDEGHIVSKNVFMGLTQGGFFMGDAFVVTENMISHRSDYLFWEQPDGLIIMDGSNGVMADNTLFLKLDSEVDATCGICLFSFAEPANSNVIRDNRIRWSAPFNASQADPIVLLDFTSSSPPLVTDNIIRDNNLRGSKDASGFIDCDEIGFEPPFVDLRPFNDILDNKCGPEKGPE